MLLAGCGIPFHAVLAWESPSLLVLRRNRFVYCPAAVFDGLAHIARENKSAFQLKLTSLRKFAREVI